MNTSSPIATPDNAAAEPFEPDFDTAYSIDRHGNITPATGEYIPDVQHDEAHDVLIDGTPRADTAPGQWQVLTGHTGQYGYRGAVMHASEQWGPWATGALSALADDDTVYRVVFAIVEVRDEDGAYPDGDPVGWAVLYSVQPAAEWATIKADTHEYARKLIEAGFTVYGDAKPRRRHDGTPMPLSFFHYSREVDGRTCWGTFDDGSTGFDGPHHSMPLTPSRLNGSGATIDPVHGIGGGPGPHVESVEYARRVARPTNFCPYNAEPTVEAVDRARGNGSVPKRFYRGAILPNAKPWGIGTHYLPLSPDAAPAAETEHTA